LSLLYNLALHSSTVKGKTAEAVELPEVELSEELHFHEADIEMRLAPQPRVPTSNWHSGITNNARAAGIHLQLARQTARADGSTGLTKSRQEKRAFYFALAMPTTARLPARSANSPHHFDLDAAP
jgi:hypothetical protein